MQYLSGPQSDSKSVWRSWARNQLASPDRVATELMNQQIIEFVETEIASDLMILSYDAIHDEYDLSEVAEYFADRHCLPRIETEFRMVVRLAGSDLQRHPLGFREPAESGPKVDPKSLGVVLVPGLLFDSGGQRLGRGKGYYDRFLGALVDLDSPTVFVGISGGNIVPSLPLEPHDVRMHYLATDSAIVECEPT